MNNEQNVEGLNVSPAIAKPMLPAVFSSIEEAVKELGLSKRVRWKLYHGYLCRYTKKDVCPEFVVKDGIPVVIVRSAPTKKCWNCKHRTQAFKVGKLTHYHCMSPTYERQHKEGVAISPWETLRVFSDSCDEHELR